VSTICRFLHRNGFSRQKLRLVAQQRNQELRQRFMTECSAYRPEMFVFVDETGSNRRNAMRKFGYSLVGKTPSVSRLQVRGKRFSVIAALTLDSIIATLVTSNTVTAVTFEEFIVSKLLTRHITAKTEVCRSYLGYAPCESRGMNFIPLDLQGAYPRYDTYFRFCCVCHSMVSTPTAFWCWTMLQYTTCNKYLN